jgi:peptidoglycan-associated lipoprotein
MKKLVGLMLVGVLLTGCGTSVPLTDVPVVDASVKSVDPKVGGSGVGSGGVAAVDLGGATPQVSPSSVPRIVYFDYDSFVIKPEFQKLIADHAQVIKSQSSRKVAIEGHTDETGGREYNLALGQKRADAVAGALSILGVPKSQIEAVSFGKEKPAVVGADESAYSKNRRTEIRYQ